jgi:hypothetical protein
MEKRPIRYNKRLKQHSELAEQMDTILKKVRRYEIPFKVTYYTIPDSQRTDFIEQRKKDPKKIIKPLTEEQIENLRSLGYVD